MSGRQREARHLLVWPGGRREGGGVREGGHVEGRGRHVVGRHGSVHGGELVVLVMLGGLVGEVQGSSLACGTVLVVNHVVGRLCGGRGVWLRHDRRRDGHTGGGCRTC